MKNNKLIAALSLAVCCSWPVAAKADAQFQIICMNGARQKAKQILMENNAAAMKSELKAIAERSAVVRTVSLYKRRAEVQRAMAALNASLDKNTRLQDDDAVAELASTLSLKAAESARLTRQIGELRSAVEAAIKAKGSSAELAGAEIVLRKKIQRHDFSLMYCRGTATASKEILVSYVLGTGQYQVSISKHDGKSCEYTIGLGQFASNLVAEAVNQKYERGSKCEFSELFMQSQSVLD
jgi:hypothetical protein